MMVPLNVRLTDVVLLEFPSVLFEFGTDSSRVNALEQRVLLCRCCRILWCSRPNCFPIEVAYARGKPGHCS